MKTLLLRQVKQRECVWSIFYVPLILGMSWHTVLTNTPIKYTQLPPIEQRKSGAQLCSVGTQDSTGRQGSQGLNSLKVGPPFNSEHLRLAQHQGGVEALDKCLLN